MSEKEEYDDSDYIGNIWGWKTSFYSLAFILSILLLMWYLSWKRGVPVNYQPEDILENDSLSSLQHQSEATKRWEWS